MLDWNSAQNPRIQARGGVPAKITNPYRSDESDQDHCAVCGEGSPNRDGARHGPSVPGANADERAPFGASSPRRGTTAHAAGCRGQPAIAAPPPPTKSRWETAFKSGGIAKREVLATWDGLASALDRYGRNPSRENRRAVQLALARMRKALQLRPGRSERPQGRRSVPSIATLLSWRWPPPQSRRVASRPSSWARSRSLFTACSAFRRCDNRRARALLGRDGCSPPKGATDWEDVPATPCRCCADSDVKAHVLPMAGVTMLSAAVVGGAIVAMSAMALR